MKRKASELMRGDVFRLRVACEVLATTPVAGAKRIKVSVALEDQGRRTQHGTPTDSNKPNPLEFLDNGHVLEFVCKPGRAFRLLEWFDNDGDDNDDGTEVEGPRPSSPLLVE